jgi:hypothetical protein
MQPADILSGRSGMVRMDHARAAGVIGLARYIPRTSRGN